MTEINLRERRLSLEIIMPMTALGALIVGAVVAFAQPPPVEQVAIPAHVALPPPIEMEDEEIVTTVTEEAEAMIVETPIISGKGEAKKVPALIANAPQLDEDEFAAEEADDAPGVSKLVLDVPDGATIYLDKNKLGIAPLEKKEIIEGRYLIKVEVGDSTFSEWVDVPPGGTFTYRLSISNDQAN